MEMFVVLQDGEVLKADNGDMIMLDSGKIIAPCETLTEASKKVRAFIEKNLLGSSSFTGGKVYTKDGNTLIARISYNGRIWDPYIDFKEIIE